MSTTLRLSCVLALFVTLPSCSGGSDGDNQAEAGGSSAGGKNSAGGKASGGGNGSAGTLSSSGGNGNGSAGTPSSSAGTASSGSGGGAPRQPNEIGGCKVFPANDDWNLDISGQPADATWTRKVQALVGSAKLHPDYGADGAELYGIPINVVPASQALTPVLFDEYPDESDQGPFPFPTPGGVQIEGNTPESCDGDCHVLVVQQGSCQLYEGYACEYRQNAWHCANGAKWNLNEVAYGQRTEGWTSADAAGLPIAPGVLRYDEVRTGEVTHALRFTLDCTTNKYVKPARHQAVPEGCDPNDGLPMGTRVRLKASYDTSKLSKSAQVVLAGMKKYGMILADNGGNFYFQGEANAGWTEDDIEPLKSVPADAFEVVQMPQLMP